MLANTGPQKSKISDRPALNMAMLTLSNQDHFSFNELLTVAAEYIKSRSLLEGLPASINLDKLMPACCRLSDLAASDNLERGRCCFLDPDSRQLLLGKTSKGTEESVSISKVPPEDSVSTKLSPVMVMHAHTNYSSGDRSSFHISKDDIREFLNDPHILIEIIIHDDQALLAIKHAKTEQNQTREELDKIFEKVELLYRNGKQIDWSITQAFCQELGIGLYAVDYKKNSLASRIL